MANGTVEEIRRRLVEWLASVDELLAPRPEPVAVAVKPGRPAPVHPPRRA